MTFLKSLCHQPLIPAVLKLPTWPPTFISIATLLNGIINGWSKHKTRSGESHFQLKNSIDKQQWKAEESELASTDKSRAGAESASVEPGWQYFAFSFLKLAKILRQPFILTFQPQAQAASAQLRTPRLQQSLRRTDGGNQPGGLASRLRGGQGLQHGVHQEAPGVQGRIVYNRQVWMYNKLI